MSTLPGPHPTPQPPETSESAASASTSTSGAEAPAEFPFVALTVRTTGIHPSTGRVVAIDAVTFSESGAVGEDYHVVINPETDPGPRHIHGLSHEEVAEGEPFARVLKTLDRLLDGRTLVVHNTPYTWGFIVAEARRAMVAAARQNRSRNRGRSGGRRRAKVGHVPTPERIIDTLETSRRQGVRSNDVRLGAVAKRSGIDAPDPKATVERAQRSEFDVTRAETQLLIELFQAQSEGEISSYAPDDIRADRFGLQRSHVRVDAAEAPRQHANPGKYVPGKNLVRGMEIVVAPEIKADPDVIIEALMREELNYSEKLTRETSVVVCNVTTDLVGKPMHAHRKGIPLMADEAFLAALGRIEEAPEPEPEQEEKRTPHVPNSNNRRGGGRNQRRRHKRKATPQRSGDNAAAKNDAGASASSESGASAVGAATGGAQASGQPSGDNAAPGKGRRRRRRGGRGGRNGRGNRNSGGTAASNND
ncbi:MAG: DNA polymerase III subunit epsilon [Corynebacterium flavescens]|nr:exonuclease domain-containing protein [Corynebacterium flavescens]MDN6430902.1 DNA polymerase III subunit epsilon [Corynebacterium flavescens]MDN6600625.1 DNA polymerase III subunit epsilon [Corynebacterium flavescens]MDN6823328.1 DNA polymerase III subunit epsilon [Corynebacterium flavescens]